MATNPETSADVIPVACSLSSADLAGQAARWGRLAARALRSAKLGARPSQSVRSSSRGPRAAGSERR